MRTVCKTLAGKPEGKELEDLSTGMRIILKLVLKK
jgi:hypothetical protein